MEKIIGISAKELLEQPKTPSTVKIENEEFVIIDEGYSFETSRCNDPFKLVVWIGHLTEKNWCTTEMISDLIDEFCKEYKYDRNWNC